MRRCVVRHWIGFLIVVSGLAAGCPLEAAGQSHSAELVPAALAGNLPGIPKPAEARPASESALESGEITGILERGPVRLTWQLSPSPARLSDDVCLVVTVQHARGVEWVSSDPVETLGDFSLRVFREELPESRQGEVIRKFTYFLEPTLVGVAQLGPLRIRYRDRSSSADGIEQVLRTDLLSVPVHSSVPEGLVRLTELRGLAGPIPLKKRNAWSWWWLSLALLPGAMAGFWWTRRRKVPQQGSPRETAELELTRLWESELARRDIKAFYREMTDTVRRYLESSTGIRAPEQTTEEFLQAVSSDLSFGPTLRVRLQEFLEIADLVKFAAYEPEWGDIEDAYHRAQACLATISRETSA